MVFVSQGVPLTLPAVQAARDKGVPISSMTHLFLELCPGMVIGITGSSGKTTTTALVGAMFEAAGFPPVRQARKRTVMRLAAFPQIARSSGGLALDRPLSTP